MWELDCEESWAPKNWCFWTVVLEKTLESPLDCKETQPVHPKGNQLNVHWKDWYRSWNSSTLVTWCEELTHLERPWCWERLKAGGEGDYRGWDGGMPSLTQWAWVWVNSVSWWWTGRPGMLQPMGSQSQTWLSDWTELDFSSLEIDPWLQGSNGATYFMWAKSFPDLIFLEKMMWPKFHKILTSLNISLKEQLASYLA